MANLVRVEFIAKYPPFNIREQAAYEPAMAGRLVNGGIAVYVIDKEDGAENILSEPQSIGGNWYDLGVEKIQGKEVAWERYHELSGTDPPPEGETEGEGEEEEPEG